MAVRPCNVAIVIVGAATDTGKLFEERALSADMPRIDIFDLTKTLTDRVDGFSLTQWDNGDSAKTQQAIFAQEGIVDAVEVMVAHIVELKDSAVVWQDGTVHLPAAVGSKCKKGIHRSDTVGKCTAAILNRMEDADGNRVFNCQTFSLSAGGHKHAAAWEQSTWQNAETWLTDAWLVVDGGSAVPMEQFYAYGACMQRRECAANWHAVFNLVSKYSPRQDNVEMNKTMVSDVFS